MPGGRIVDPHGVALTPPDPNDLPPGEEPVTMSPQAFQRCVNQVVDLAKRVGIPEKEAGRYNFLVSWLPFIVRLFLRVKGLQDRIETLEGQVAKLRRGED